MSAATEGAPGGVAVDLDQPLELHELVYLEEGEEVTVGRPDIDSYGIFPPDGAALVRRLAAGTPPGEAARWYTDTYGETVDLAEFLATLDELGFIRSGADDAGPAAPVRWQRLGRAAFSPFAWVCYAVLVGWCLFLMLDQPELRPSYQHIFFSEYVTAIELGLFLGQIPALLIHESFHALAGRRLGLRSQLRLSRRLYFLVFETSLDGLVAVPRRQRYLPMLAGMLADALVFSLLTITAALTRQPDGELSLLGAVCLGMAFTTVLRFVWQFYFYLQTDIYHVVCTTIGCVDLQTAARRTLGNRFWRLLRRPDRVLDESTWHPRDRAVARWYSWLLLVGYTAMIVTLVVAVIPAATRFLSHVFERFGAGTPAGELTDTLVFLALNVAQLVLILALVVRDRRRRQPEPTHLLT